VGNNQVTWRAVVERALGSALDQLGSEHLPGGYLDDPSLLADGLAERLGMLADAVRDLDPTAVADAEVRRFLTSRPLWQRGGLRDQIAVRDLADDTRLRRRPGHPCVTRAEGDRLLVMLGDRELRMPGHLAPALEMIGSRATFTPADLADHLDLQSRLVLCRRLVREGLLAVT
jgi:hypothetical protein